MTGLVAARNLASAGIEVQVLEASERPGGQIHTVTLADRRIDVGAEALHLAGPHVSALLADVGLADALVTAAGSRTWIWSKRGLRRLPAGVGPAGPTRLAPLLSAGLFSPLGLARAALEPLVPAPRIDGDVAVGDFLSRRLGQQVADRLVDPLLGGLHAGDIHRLSLRAATPYLAHLLEGHRSLLSLPGRSARRPATGGAGGPVRGGPSFNTFADGLSTLVDALAATPGVSITTGTPVRALHGDSHGVEAETATGERLSAAAVVLALPARAAAAILGESTLSGGDPAAAAAGLGELRAASVVTLLAAYPRARIESLPAFDATGILVPSGAGRFLKAATFLSRKWPNLADGDLFFLRMSAGRSGDTTAVTSLDDDELRGRLGADLAAMTGLCDEPVASHIERWPGAMAQLEVGHLERLRAIRAALPPTVALAGAPYEGVGLASCIRSGANAATQIQQAMHEMSEQQP